MPAPRLIFVNRFFSPDHSATAQILADLTQHLAARGHDVHVITSRSLYSDPSVALDRREEIDGATVTRVWTSRFGRSGLAGRAMDYLSFYPTMALSLWRLARRGDVIIAKTDPPLLSIVAAPVAALKGVHLVNWLQDLYPEVAAALGMGTARGPLGGAARALRNASLKAARVNVAIGETMAARIADEGVARTAIAVIPNWSDDVAITPQPLDGAGLRAAWGFAQGDFVVGYSGNLGQAHEVETLFGAAERLRDQDHIKFLFVGGGRHSDGLRRRAREAGLANFVFQPYQPRERLAQSLAVPDVHWLSLKPQMEGLIVPSKYYGIAAAGRGAIVVGSPDGELGALVRNEGGGLAVAPGDVAGLTQAIRSLEADRAACAAMGRQARDNLEARFTKASSLERWEKLLANIAGG
jgi:glycosyltransferase involved in cell wall biosynthesis